MPRVRRTNLVVIAGPTGVGKTDHAIELARKFGAPIVVLDRVQCHPELAVGSGRHHEDESVRRIFLDERRVADGTLTASSAQRRLAEVLDARRAEGDRAVILEGGSISLLDAMTRDTRWRHDADVCVEWLAPDAGHYHERLARRVTRMLTGEPSLLDEVRALWPDRATHPVLADIVGYRQVIDAIRATGGVEFDRRTLRALVEDVTDAHLAYAERQCRRLPVALAALQAKCGPNAATSADLDRTPITEATGEPST